MTNGVKLTGIQKDIIDKFTNWMIEETTVDNPTGEEQLITLTLPILNRINDKFEIEVQTAINPKTDKYEIRLSDMGETKNEFDMSGVYLMKEEVLSYFPLLGVKIENEELVLEEEMNNKVWQKIFYYLQGLTVLNNLGRH